MILENLRTMTWCSTFQAVLLVLLLNTSEQQFGCESLHIQDVFETDTFFVFLSKFGFQRTEPINTNNTHGYIFGNVTDENDDGLEPFLPTVKPAAAPPTVSTSKKSSTTSTALPSSSTSENNSSNKSVSWPQNESSPSSSTSTSTTTTTTPAPIIPSPKGATLVVVDRSYFLDFYRNRNVENKDEACRLMFEDISPRTSFDANCDPIVRPPAFTRRLPCSKNGVCVDEINLSSVVEGYQFTYPIVDRNQAKFWYASIVACFQDKKDCRWKHSGNSTVLDYDIWFVNGNPYTKQKNPLEYQFSFDRQDTVEIYLVFFLCYLILTPLQVHAVLRQRHIVPRMFTGSIALELGAVLANVVHVLTFSLDGEGYPGLAIFGDILDILARAIYMLILLVLAKGWAVTRTELTGKPFIFSIWTIYVVIHILLYVWNQTEVDVIEDIDEYQTWPGWLILILRTIIMMWFVYELKDTMDHEHQPHKLNFFLHFGAAALVWFIYLPIIALIALQVSPLWRFKLLLGITYSADCLAFAVMTHLLWPTRSQQYFLLTSNRDTSLTDELEEFNEAPHVANPYARRSNNRLPTNYSFHDVSSPEAISLTRSPRSNSFINSNFVNNNSHESGAFNYGDEKDITPLIVT